MPAVNRVVSFTFLFLNIMRVLRAIQRVFTLIELLVVIAIISILMSILLPALKNARAKGNEISCKSNLKQMGLAFSLYLGDYDGYYPSYGLPSSSGGNGSCWDGKIAPYLGLDASNLLQPGTVFWCPSGTQSHPSYFRNYGAHSGMGRTTYSYCFLKDNQLPRNASDLSIVSDTNDYFLFGGSTNGEYHTAKDNGGNSNYRHSGGNALNLLFADGHVDLATLIECQNNNWWFQ